MNKRYISKTTKQKNEYGRRTVKQLLISIIVFISVISVSNISPEFKRIAKDYTRENTDFISVGKIAFQKIEQCFKEYSEMTDIK